jgi:hypothetical protein
MQPADPSDARRESAHRPSVALRLGDFAAYRSAVDVGGWCVFLYQRQGFRLKRELARVRDVSVFASTRCRPAADTAIQPPSMSGIGSEAGSEAGRLARVSVIETPVRQCARGWRTRPRSRTS